jgi:phenylacetic acid degradation protein
VLMDDVVVGEEALVGASSFVRAGFIVRPRTLVTGAPAREVRALTEEEIAWKAVGTREYQELAVRCLASLKECAPLTTIPPGRENAPQRPVNTTPLHTIERRK